jgi:hypothetical protein
MKTKSEKENMMEEQQVLVLVTVRGRACDIQKDVNAWCRIASCGQERINNTKIIGVKVAE